MDETKNDKRNKTKSVGMIVVACLALASLAYRIITESGLSNSSLLFVGIPAIITLTYIKYSRRPSTLLAAVFRIITMFLLLSAVLFGEGFVCILIAAPIFYGVATILIILYDWLFHKGDSRLYTLGVIGILCLLLEVWNFSDPYVDQHVQVSRTYAELKTIDNLSQPVDLSNELPTFLSFGFPVPISSHGTGLAIGDRWETTFLSQTRGEGTLALEVAEVSAHHVHYTPVSDNSHIGRWLRWTASSVDIQETNDGCIVTWSLDYQCKLHPFWYFKPIQQYGVSLSAEHLITTYFGDE